MDDLVAYIVALLASLLVGTALTVWLGHRIGEKPGAHPGGWMLVASASGLVNLGIGLAGFAVLRGHSRDEPIAAGLLVVGFIGLVMPAGLSSRFVGPAMQRVNMKVWGTRFGFLVGVVLGAVLGVLASQYFPIFGGFENVGTPWSPARISLVPTHLLVLAVGGGVIGALLGRSMNASGQTISPASVAVLVRPNGAERLMELKSLLEKGLITKAEYETKREEIVKSL